MIDKVKCTYCENDPFPISDIKDAEKFSSVQGWDRVGEERIVRGPRYNRADRGEHSYHLVATNGRIRIGNDRARERR